MCAAGNNGPDKRTITAPGVSKKIITVGCLDDILADNKNSTCNKKNKHSYTGRGPTCHCIIKPDIVCTGNQIPSLANNYACYTKKSGTSMATPIVSATILLLLEKKTYLTPKDIKILLKNSAKDLKVSRNIQGFGELDIERFMQ